MFQKNGNITVFQQISTWHDFIFVQPKGMLGFILIMHGLECFQVHIFQEHLLPPNNNKFRIVVICNRLLAYITAFVMLHMILCFFKADFHGAAFSAWAKILSFTRENVVVLKLKRKLQLSDLILCKIFLEQNVQVHGNMPLHISSWEPRKSRSQGKVFANLSRIYFSPYPFCHKKTLPKKLKKCCWN